MAIFDRLSDLVRSNVNDLIDRAENPEKMCKQIIIDMESQLQKATTAYGAALASEKQAKKQLEAAEQESANWTAKAKLALGAGDEALAKQALEKKVASDKNAETLREMHTQMAAQLDVVRAQIDALKSKLEEARSKQALLVARSKMADAQKTMATSLGSLDNKSAFAKLDKMEQKIAAKEAQAQAFGEVAGTAESAEPDPFAALETSAAVDDELAKLRAELGQ